MTRGEISVPFRLDSQGRVAVMLNPNDVARQHLTTYLLTRPTERVMRPAFGTPVRDLAFENLDPLQFQLLSTSVISKVNEDVSGVILQTMATASDYDDATLNLTVSFALAVGQGQGATLTTTVNTGGTL